MSPIAARMRTDTLALMAQHAAIPARGWNAQRARHALHRQIDELLDQHALETLLWAESVPRTIA